MDNPKETDYFKITLAVIAGIVLAYFLIQAVERWRINQALQEFNRQAEAMLRSTQEETNRRMAEELRARELAAFQEHVRKAEQDRTRAAQMRVEVESKKAALAADEARELAWKKFYTKPAHCDAAVGPALVECGNQHIRARREFEQRYAKGRL